MATWLDDNKRVLQILLGIQRQNSFQFGMHGILGRRQGAEIDDSRPAALDKDKAAEIAVAGDENTALLVCDPKQFRVFGLAQAKQSRRCYVMAQAGQEANRSGIDILVGQKLHGVGARRMSSTASTSIAY